MPRPQPRRFALALASVLLAFTLAAGLSCKPKGEDIALIYPQFPPLPKVEERSAAFLPSSQKFNLAILTFIDQTGKAGIATDPLADMLTTELDATRRFALFDRRDFKAAGHRDSSTKQVTQTETGETKATVTVQAIAEQKAVEQAEKVGASVDGVLLGYITSFDVASGGNSGTMTIDYRIVNTAASKLTEEEAAKNDLKNLIVASGSGEVRFKTNSSQSSLEIDRPSIALIAQNIKSDFTTRYSTEHNVEVQKVEGRHITINVGEEHNIRPGFVGFVVRETRLGTVDYLAYFVVMNTFERAAVGYVLTDPRSLSAVRIGSQVRIK